jgi:hypothetical protein
MAFLGLAMQMIWIYMVGKCLSCAGRERSVLTFASDLQSRDSDTFGVVVIYISVVWWRHNASRSYGPFAGQSSCW